MLGGPFDGGEMETVRGALAIGLYWLHWLHLDTRQPEMDPTPDTTGMVYCLLGHNLRGCLST